MVETSTSNHVHIVNGLICDELETIQATHRPGLNDALPVLSEEVLYAVPTMSSEVRRTRIPRIGLTPQTCWETARSEVEHGLASVAVSTPYDDDLQLYLIPFHACADFYWPGVDQPELTDPRVYISEVGFDFAPEIDFKKAQERSLWEAVFGEALIPEGSSEIAPQKESAEAIRSDPQA